MKGIRILCSGLLTLSLALVPLSAWSHCQMPCGIYDDATRFALLAEDITTIEKSMNQIKELSAAGEVNYNQLVRWIDTKETHAGMFMEVVTDYFMTQRIKPVDESDKEHYATYVKQVSLLHQMLIAAMHCKQTTDLQYTAELTSLLTEFKALYLK